MSFQSIPGLNEAQEKYDKMLPSEDPHPQCMCGHELSKHDLTIDFEDLVYDDACKVCEKSCLGFELAYDRRHSMDGSDRFCDWVHSRDTEERA